MRECIETSIAYYEFMIDMEREYQHIKEECFNEKVYQLKSIEESVKDRVNSAIKFIKEIFNKIVEFFKNIIKSFKKVESTHLKVNMKLVRACENKIKTMSAEEQRTFRIPKSLYSNNMVTFVKFMNENNEFVANILKKLTYELEKCNSDKQYVPNVSEQDMQSIDEINSSYDKLSDSNTLKSDMNDVTFGDINNVLEDYKKSSNTINIVSAALIQSQKVAEDCKKRVDKLVEDPDNASDKFFNDFKTAMHKTANLIIKISKGIIDTSVAMFRNYENILNAFVNWGTNTESFYFEDEDVLYLL